MRSTLITLILTALCLPLAAEQWTIDDIVLTERVRSFQISRDGRLAVWARSKMDKEKGRAVSHLFLHNLKEDYTVQLTRGQESASSPVFSPDGRRIAFLSNSPSGSGGEDEKTQQVWLIDTRGGAAFSLTEFTKGVKAVNWIDNDNLLVTATEDPTLYHQEVDDRKDTSNVVDDEEHALPVRLYRFSIDDKKADRLTNNTDRITKTFVSDDGAWAVTVHERSLSWTYNQAIRPFTFLHNLEEGTEKQLFTDAKLIPEKVDFTFDGGAFYFSAPYSTHPKYLFGATPMLYYFDISSSQTTQVDLQSDWGLGSDFAVTRDGVLALLAAGVRYQPALYTRSSSGWTRRNLEGEHGENIFGVELSRNGETLVYDHTTASKPTQWYAAQLSGASIVDASVITKLNTHMDKKPKARTEVVRWTGARDDEVEGILYYPHEYEEGNKYPLVLMIHGGPHGTDFDRWSDREGYPHQLFAQRGAFILKPNYHGSGNYGVEWGESISGGNYNDLEWIDAERGVDAMIDRGLADPDKLGVMGWSNGSIITIEITTRVDRYKVASAGAGDVNWLSDWGNCQFGHAFDDYYLGTTPLDDPEFYLEKSPLFRMDKVTTPTIIYFGTTDRQVPTEQGWQHFRALQHLGKTDVKFILFPGEAHTFQKYSHLHRKVAEDLAWFDKYLFQPDKEKNKSLKPGSPLHAILQRKGGGEFPETVLRGDLRIGRFEVTREQYAAYDSDYSYPAGTGSYPASGISFDDAKAYCSWLANKSGRKFRLGAEKELAKYLTASAKGNTLDAWAGYAVNPDDAEALAGLLRGVDPDALLKPVGSHSGAGEDPLFDLDGNVAEWVVAGDGSGKPLGGSADRPADAKANGEPATGYIGFRVVEEL